MAVGKQMILFYLAYAEIQQTLSAKFSIGHVKKNEIRHCLSNLLYQAPETPSQKLTITQAFSAKPFDITFSQLKLLSSRSFTLGWSHYVTLLTIDNVEEQRFYEIVMWDKLSHQDLGQMQMYVNYFDRFVKTDDETPTIGIVLCHRKHDALVELTLPKDGLLDSLMSKIRQTCLSLGLSIKFGINGLRLLPTVRAIENMDRLEMIKEAIKATDKLKEIEAVLEG